MTLLCPALGPWEKYGPGGEPMNLGMLDELEYATLWWTNIAMENHHFFMGKIHYKWPFSIAMLVHQRVCYLYMTENDLNIQILWV